MADLRFGSLRTASVSEVPDIGYCILFPVDRFNTRIDLQWQAARSFVDNKLVYQWRAVAAIVFNITKSRIVVLGKPSASVFQEVKPSVGAHFHIDQVVHFDFGSKRLHFIEGPVLKQAYCLHPSAHPLIDDYLPVIIRRY